MLTIFNFFEYVLKDVRKSTVSNHHKHAPKIWWIGVLAYIPKRSEPKRRAHIFFITKRLLLLTEF
jgi:hypothetical protein